LPSRGREGDRRRPRLQEHRRRGDEQLPELSVAQIEQQLNLAVDRVMTEGGIADRELAALALKQASGDNVEAIFLLRAYRTTLPRLAVSEPEYGGDAPGTPHSAVYKDIPGGQLLGPTYDYTHRLLDFTLLANGEAPLSAPPTPNRNRLRTSLACWRSRGWRRRKKIRRAAGRHHPHAAGLPLLALVAPAAADARRRRLSAGAGLLHPARLRAQPPVCRRNSQRLYRRGIVPEELGFAVNVGELLMTECEMVNGFVAPEERPALTRGYGLCSA
jgi:alpha-D-ribose 1-methylphosphonate 5-triphosphate synthase subunit PhnI